MSGCSGSKILDTPRVVPGAADEILRTLEQFGFEWDGEIVRQSARTDLYQASLARLDAAGACFTCSCSRGELAALQTMIMAEEDSFYAGTCRNGPQHVDRALAVRFRAADSAIEFEDELQGRLVQNVGQSLGDFIIRRRDGLFAYQLAVVVDDADQQVTQVVRGSDLLSNTPRQILLQQALQLPRPLYMHLPLLTETDGRKLSKSQHCGCGYDGVSLPSLCIEPCAGWRQQPPPELAHVSTRELWSWAIRAWNPKPLRNVREIRLDTVE